MSEADVQATVVYWAMLQERKYPALKLLFHPANGEYRSKAAGARLKKMGVKKGVPDLMLPYPAKGFAGLALEMKDGNKPPSKDQKMWLKMLGEAGWDTGVYGTSIEAIEQIADYLDIERDDRPF